MSINMKSLSALLFTGLFLQTFVFSNISVGPEIMKLSPFYSPQLKQPVFEQLAQYTPKAHR